MLHCPTCKGPMRRVHRTFVEKFLYMGMYECRQCHTRKPEPRWYALYLGVYPRCPRCGTYRLTRLATRDKIDRMHSGLINFAQKVYGADLYHCRYCRVQFYDMRRPIAPDVREKEKAKAAAVARVAVAETAAED